MKPLLLPVISKLDLRPQGRFQMEDYLASMTWNFPPAPLVSFTNNEVCSMFSVRQQMKNAA
jgi:hypothetical protein